MNRYWCELITEARFLQGKSMLNRIYSQLISGHLKHDIIAYANAKNIINVAVISIIAIPFYALIYYFFNDPKVSYLLLVLSIFFLFSIWIIQATGSLTMSREIFVGSLFVCLFWISYNTGGFHSSAAIWLALPPLLAIVFGNIYSGIFWGVVGIVSFLVLFLLSDYNVPLPNSHISNSLLLDVYSRSGLVIVMFLLAYFFDLGKRDAILKLELAKQESDYLSQKAQEAVRAKNEFLENMSHELRTPLNSIMGFAELMTSNKINPETHNELNNIILSSSKDLTKMIENMLDMSQIELEQIEFIPTDVSLPKLIDEVKLIHNDLISGKNLQLSIIINPTIKMIKTDPDKLRLMLSCYLSNAIKFSDKNKKIEIRAFPLSTNEFCIEVEDQGIGIKKEDLNKLFTPFTQIDMSATKKYQGIGIELALTHRIAEAQGGRVGVKSEIGKGSIFFIILPKKEQNQM